MEPGYEEWLERRDEYRERLFGESQASLARLAINIESFGRGKRKEAGTERGGAERSVREIIELHDKQARQPEGALFGLVDEDAKEVVVSITGKVIDTWERTCSKKGLDSPFVSLPNARLTPSDLENPAVQLIIETSTAVVECLQTGYPVKHAEGHYTHERLAKLIAYRGPDFAAAWARGDIIREYCERSGKGAERWLSYETRGVRMRGALERTKNPLEGVY